MKTTKIIFLALIILSACNNSVESTSTLQPVLADFELGEKWVWKFKGLSSEGEVRAEGEDTRMIVNTEDGLGMTIGNDTVALSEIVKPDESETPKYDWPLEVGKKWKYENNWTSQDGTIGSQSQDAEVLFYQEETVAAGTFLAYTIKYQGEISNSRGYNAKVEETWLYAPALKNFIKLIQKQEDYYYEEELIEYSKH